MAEIRLDDLDAVEQIRNLAAALIVPSQHGNPFWDNAARQILDGILAHVLTSPAIPDSERHLGTARDYVAQTNGRKMFDLRGNMALGALADKAEALFRQASADAGGDIMTTLNVHMQWLDSPAMRDALAESDFSFAELKNTESTVFLVIPPEYLDTHARYLRLFITLALRAAGRGRKARHAMLFILDEFAALGELKVVSDAAGQLAGMGVKLWPIIQNLTQLRPYGDNWEVFLANAGQHQVFAMNDQTTARYFSERLGDHIAWRKVRTQRGYEWVPHGATLLRTGPELARESSKDNEKALMFFEGGEVSLVRRAAYDAIFRKEDYDPNPYQSAPAGRLASVLRGLRDVRERVRGELSRVREDGFQSLIQSRAGPRIVALLGDSFSAKAMTEARAIYNAPTEAAQCAAFNRAADALNRAVKDGNAAEIRAWQFVFVEYEALLEGKEPRNESERRNLKMAQKLMVYGDDPATPDSAAAPSELAPASTGAQGAGPGFVADSEAAPPAFAGAGSEPDAPFLPKPLKAPPLKKPRKPRGKKPPP